MPGVSLLRVAPPRETNLAMYFFNEVLRISITMALVSRPQVLSIAIAIAIDTGIERSIPIAIGSTWGQLISGSFGTPGFQ